MKNYTFLFKLAIVMIMLLAGIYFYPRLPASMPIHWNFAGQVDNYAPKGQVVFMFPGIALIILILFHFLPKIDPNKENYPKFKKAWEVFQYSLLIFFAYAYGLTIFATLDKTINVGKYMTLGIGILFIVLGNYMGKIRKNYFVGIKLPWTIANEEVWNKTHRLGGKMFMLGGLLFILNSFLNFSPVIVFLIIIGIILFIPIIYSYVIFRRIKS